MYLEGLRPGMDDSDTVQTPRTKASSVARSQASSWRQRGYANGEDEDELASNVQEGKQSTLGSMVRRNGVVSSNILDHFSSLYSRGSLVSLGPMISLGLTMRLLVHRSVILDLSRRTVRTVELEL